MHTNSFARVKCSKLHAGFESRIMWDGWIFDFKAIVYVAPIKLIEQIEVSRTYIYNAINLLAIDIVTYCKYSYQRALFNSRIFKPSLRVIIGEFIWSSHNQSQASSHYLKIILIHNNKHISMYTISYSLKAVIINQNVISRALNTHGVFETIVE